MTPTASGRILALQDDSVESMFVLIGVSVQWQNLLVSPKQEMRF